MFPRHNQSAVPQLFLLGFQFLNFSRIIIFLHLFVIYISTIIGNLLIIIVVSATRKLRSPMYLFLCHLSFCDILFSSSIIPNLLHVTLYNGSYLTVSGCITQFHFFGLCSTSECFLLTVMSYDRYLAICKPLHYQTVMHFSFCHGLVVFSWTLGLVLTSIITILISQLHFCKSGNIDHFFCDFAPLVQLSCSETTIVEIAVFIIATPETLIGTMSIATSYICIFLAIRRISSTTGKQKAFSTCSSHLAVVCMYYGSLIVIYVASSGQNSSNMKKIVSLMYTVMTPLLNPIIYSLRNQEIKNILETAFEKTRTRRL